MEQMIKIIESIKNEYYSKVISGIQQRLDSQEQNIKDFFTVLGDLKEVITTQNIHKIIANIEDVYSESSFITENDKGIKEKTTFCNTVLSVLGYASFRSSKHAIWLAKKLNIKSCLFCNTQYATVIETTDGDEKVYFQFDHFYPKSRFPYLSMSIYNLVPICPYCNQAKSDNKPEFANPYLRNFTEFTKFKIKDECKLDFFINPTGTISESIEYQTKSDELVNYDKQFQILAKHRVHEDIVQELMWKAKVYTEDYRQQLIKLLGGVLNDADIERFIIGSYSTKEDIFQRPLTKLTQDIAEYLGLI
jgi:hypothetical protein